MGCSPVRGVNKNYPAIAPIENSGDLMEIAGITFKAMDEDFELTSAVEISISCNLEEACDCLAVFYSDEAVLEEIGRTEIQKATNSPVFINTFRVTYSFEKQSKYRFDIYGIKHFNSKSLLRQNFLGSAKYNIHEIICAPEQKLTKHFSKAGTITVFSEELSRLNHKIKLKLAIDCKKSSGIYSIKVSRSSKTRCIPVYITEGIEGIPCIWESFELTVNKLCNGHLESPVKFELIRHDPKEASLTSLEVTLEELKAAENFERPIEINRSKALFKVVEFIYAEKPTFLDYVFGGCEVSLIIGIDFTKSNGIQNSIKSLHHLSEDRPNEYIQAIKAVGEILQYYDSDKQIPVFGFGARLPPHLNVVSHCFALNGNIFSPEVDEISGVMEVYNKTLEEIALHGPTVFNELIKEVIRYASIEEVTQQNQRYQILLVLTDGGISDMNSTIQQIIKAAELPISIVIVGVGNEDFEEMSRLDADKEPLIDKKTGCVMKRDIVQFVPYSKFKSDIQLLAREVLYEIPNQFLEFMESREIKPNVAKGDKLDIVFKAKKSMSVNFTNKDKSIFLQNDKEKFINKVVALGFDRDLVEYALEDGIACRSVELAIEMINLAKKPVRKILKDRKGELCKCFKRKINCYGVECGHLICCSECISQFSICPVCKIELINWKTTDN